MIKLDGISLPACHSFSDIEKAVLKKSGAKKTGKIKILKKSIDARKKSDVRVIYSVAAEISGVRDFDKYIPDKRLEVPKSKDKKIIIVGSGPAGLFAALTLVKAGLCPIILERGSKIKDRIKSVQNFEENGILSENCNIQFGEGGAGTFSDGKLNTGIKSPLIREVLNTFYDFGAPEEILYNTKPHIGTDKLRSVISSMTNYIEKCGGKFYFDTLVTDFIVSSGKLLGVSTTKGEFYADSVILATGHSAREVFESLYKSGVSLTAKPFSVGARIEHLQSDINLCQYGKFSKHLPPADYKIFCHLPNGLSVYTFCMCPGGVVSAASSEKGGIVTNGCSNFARDGQNANSAVLVSVTPEIFGKGPLSGIDFQRKIETAAYNISGSYKAPCQTVGDFLKGIKTETHGKVIPSYPLGVTYSDISLCLPDFVVSALKDGIKLLSNKISCFAESDALLTAPETRSSSPVRIERNEHFESSLSGLYPCGEGSGYAGGITSSAVDGIKTALSIIEKTV